MTTQKSPLRDRLLSNSPDPIKSSILRESGMGWSSPDSKTEDSGTGNTGSITSPLRIAKRDSPAQTPVTRRTSSSYRHVRNNHLVSKSPFKSQIPTPTTPSRHAPVPFPKPRRVSGEKRPRPVSMQEQAENENKRPFALKRERRQSKGLQGLIDKEPVTRSPFRQRPAVSQSEEQPTSPPMHSKISLSSFASHATPLSHILPPPVPPPSSPTPSAPPPSITPTRPSPSPARSSLVSRRMHGPRLSGGPGRRERRKTVTFDERCDVVEFDREDSEEDVFQSSDEDQGERNEPEKVSENEENHRHSNVLDLQDQTTEDTSSYEDIQLSDSESYDRRSPSPDSPLDPDASLTGLVEEMLSSTSSSVTATNPPLVPVALSASSTTTPHQQSEGFPAEFETEGGIPLGRSHHAERALQYHNLRRSQSPQNLPHFSSTLDSLSPMHVGEEPPTITGLPLNVVSQGVPTTPPRRNSSPLPNLTFKVEESEQTDLILSQLEVSSPPAEARRLPSPPVDTRLSHLATPPLGRSTHAERSRTARVSEENTDIEMLPPTPSPCKTARKSEESHTDNLIPKFDLGVSQENAAEVGPPSEDPFSSTIPSGDYSPSSDKSPPKNFYNLSIGSSEVNLSALSIDRLDKEARELNQSRSQNLTLLEVQHNAPDEAMGPSASESHAKSPEASSRSPMSNEGSPASPLGRHRINREEVRRRLAERRTMGSLGSGSPCADITEAPVLMGQLIQNDEHVEDNDKDRMSVMTNNTDISAETATIERAERRTLSPVRDTKSFILPTIEERLQVDFDFITKPSEELANLVFHEDNIITANPDAVDSFTVTSGTATSVGSGGSLKLGNGEVDVDMEMRSALDRLMDDVAGAKMDTSLNFSEKESSDVHQWASATPEYQERVRPELPRNDSASRNTSTSTTSSMPPPVPPKDNIRTREQLIIEKRRAARRMEEEEDDDSVQPVGLPSRKSSRSQELLGVGRPSRRRSMSTSDADTLSRSAKKRGEALLDVSGVGDTDNEDNLGSTIEKELQKLVQPPRKSKYLVREREGIVYASSSDLDQVSHMAGPGDVNAGKAWRPVRRPSDMNEYSRQIKEYRAQEKNGKAYGKVFVKVLGIKGMHLPLPQQQTLLTCTLNNGIHFVSTPECILGRDCRIDQEFELIEHSKLEFTLTLRIRRDPHIIAQFKELSPAPPPPPPPIVQSSSRGMRSFFSSPKKSKDKLITPPAPAQQRLTENLARYLKPDGTLARSFIAFKDIAGRCDTRLFETSYPLIGQRAELGGKFSTLQVGEIILQIFRLPPLPGISTDQLPQSLEECHRGLRHINWHKVTYFEGILTQLGGDCTTWRRRQFRVIGSNLVAFNDVTKKATVTIDLKKAIAAEDDQEARNNLRSPASGSSARSSRYIDEYEGLYGVERSFRLIFPNDQGIVFFADTDDEKSRWLEVFRALVGHIPPHPLWAELLWQRQDEIMRKKAVSETTQPGQ